MVVIRRRRHSCWISAMAMRPREKLNRCSHIRLSCFPVSVFRSHSLSITFTYSLWRNIKQFSEYLHIQDNILDCWVVKAAPSTSKELRYRKQSQSVSPMIHSYQDNVWWSDWPSTHAQIGWTWRCVFYWCYRVLHSSHRKAEIFKIRLCMCVTLPHMATCSTQHLHVTLRGEEVVTFQRHNMQTGNKEEKQTSNQKWAQPTALTWSMGGECVCVSWLMSV